MFLGNGVHCRMTESKEPKEEMPGLQNGISTFVPCAACDDLFLHTGFWVTSAVHYCM